MEEIWSSRSLEPRENGSTVCSLSSAQFLQALEAVFATLLLCFLLCAVAPLLVGQILALQP